MPHPTFTAAIWISDLPPNHDSDSDSNDFSVLDVTLPTGVFLLISRPSKAMFLVVRTNDAYSLLHDGYISIEKVAIPHVRLMTGKQPINNFQNFAST